jgi:hypothetical protein
MSNVESTKLISEATVPLNQTRRHKKIRDTRNQKKNVRCITGHKSNRRDLRNPKFHKTFMCNVRGWKSVITLQKNHCTLPESHSLEGLRFPSLFQSQCWGYSLPLMLLHSGLRFEGTGISDQEIEHRSTSDYVAGITGHRSDANEMTP